MSLRNVLITKLVNTQEKLYAFVRLAFVLHSENIVLVLYDREEKEKVVNLAYEVNGMEFSACDLFPFKWKEIIQVDKIDPNPLNLQTYKHHVRKTRLERYELKEAVAHLIMTQPIGSENLQRLGLPSQDFAYITDFVFDFPRVREFFQFESLMDIISDIEESKRHSKDMLIVTKGSWEFIRAVVFLAICKEFGVDAMIYYPEKETVRVSINAYPNKFLILDRLFHPHLKKTSRTLC